MGNSNVPFVNFASFEREAGFSAASTAAAEAEVAPASRSPFVTAPFVAVYELGDGEQSYDVPAREAYAELVNQLYDEEFEEALFELSTDARGLHQGHLASGYSAAEADRLLGAHFSQLVTSTEAAVDAMARQFSARDDSEIVEREVDSFVVGYVPNTPIEPAFENLFSKVLKKIGRAVKTVGGAAWKGLKKVGWGLIFSKLKALIRPFLNQVLQKAIGKLPAAVQPAAQKLAERLGFAAPKSVAPAAVAAPLAPSGADASSVSAATTDAGADASSAASAAVQEPAGGGVAAIQQEFDQQIAQAMLAQDEVELELEVARLRQVSTGVSVPVFGELNDARERFIRELDGINAGESPEPYVQNFLPAILPALKVGLRLIGRPRVVNFLGQLLSKLIAKLIGPEQAPALSRAIVDSGLKLLNLEMNEQERSGLAAAAVASTVEETVNRVASLPDHVLDNQELLEGFALEAFEQAAAANLPAVLTEATYRQRPELLEAGVNAAWLLQPFRRPRYKRCSRTFRVTITPQMAEEVESFDGSPLADYLQDQLGLAEGAEVEAQVHLYEALPGTSAADITSREAEVTGFGAADEATVAQLHPLTQEAAAVLLGRSGLGRVLPPGSSRRHLFAGQRLYHLAIAGRRPLSTLTVGGRPRARRLAHLKVVLDATQDQVRVCVFLSETKAQRLAVRLRQPLHAGSMAVGFDKLLTRRLGPILHGKRPRRLRIVHPDAAPGQSSESLLVKLPGLVPGVVVAKLKEWLLQAFSQFVKTQAPQFLAAAQDPADGVTLRFTIEHPQGLKELFQALVEKGPRGSNIAQVWAGAEAPNVRVDVSPGHKCD